MFRQKGFRKYLFLIKISKSMGKLRNDFNAFREQQDKLNQSLIKQLQSIKVQNESAMGQRHQCIENTSATAKIRLIFAKLTSFNERIRALEALNQVIFVSQFKVHELNRANSKYIYVVF